MNKDIFSLNDKSSKPLAARMRPEKLEDLAGQRHILSEKSLLFRSIKADKLSSLILYGPAGSGKTSIANIIANTTNADFIKLNASSASKKDITDIAEKALLNYTIHTRRTIIFIDEIHRFNKAQQDSLLEIVENGTVILIGATTENPYFEINNALLSRSTIFQLKPLDKEDIKTILFRATRKDIILSMPNIIIDEDVIDYFADIADGDVRTALNALELAYLSTDAVDAEIHITMEIARECIQERKMRYDKNSDMHYDTISAFILSIRGSDPDAALYYLMRMLQSGEDPKFIARRLIVSASYDIGTADPKAMEIAVSAAQAVEFVGMPECQYSLAEATIYLSCMPKSNAISEAVKSAKVDVERRQIITIPPTIKDFMYKAANKLGNGVGYKNSHDYKNHYVDQQYLPDELVNRKYYLPTDNGSEKKIKAWLNYLKDNN